MTRFARAKGSKASNEKAPEDSTPWEVMKEQLVRAKKDSEEAKKRLEAEQQRVENYNKFLKEQRVQKRQASWCDFPESNVSSKKLKESDIKQQHVTKRKKDKKQSTEMKAKSDNDDDHRTSEKDKRIKFQSKDSATSESNDQQISKKRKKKNKKKASDDSSTSQTEHSSDLNNEYKTTDQQKFNVKKSKKDKKQSTEMKSKSDNDDDHNTSAKDKRIKNQSKDSATSESNDQQISKKRKKKNKKKASNDSSTSQTEHSSDLNTESKTTDQQKFNNQKKNTPIKKKNKKYIEGKPQRRKVLDDSSFQIIINGKDVELVRFDGFPIMKKDAERLQELKNNMIKKGIPKSEVQKTIKLERRRAEKALARLKKDVCYNCRKGGHNLSDCPELKSKIPGVGGADGLCFKCGSTEHRQFECKVQKDKEFRFASCFICREQGHIARQCPDNPKGLYPNGGACKLCGDVTHLRKDCPTDQGKRVESTVKLNTIAGADNIEDIY